MSQAGAYTVSVSPTSVGKLSVYVEPVVVSVVDGERWESLALSAFCMLLCDLCLFSLRLVAECT